MNFSYCLSAFIKNRMKKIGAIKKIPMNIMIVKIIAIEGIKQKIIVNMRKNPYNLKKNFELYISVTSNCSNLVSSVGLLMRRMTPIKT